MRKSFTIIALAALVMLAGCKKNEQQPSGTKLSAGIEQHKSDSKTSLNPDDLKISWTTGDKILVNNGSEPKEFTLSSVDGEGRGEFACTGDYNFGATNVAVYPYDENTTVSGNKVTMTLPAVQNATVGTFGNGANPMLATFTDPEGITFTSLCGALCLHLTGDNVNITAIEIVGGQDDKLNGTFTADYTNPVLTYSENGTNTVRLNCEATLTATAQKFYVVLPADTLNGFTMKVYNGDNVIFTKSTANAITFQANYVESMTETPVTTHPQGSINGLFSVSATKQVYFSQGNLRAYNATANSTSGWVWSFAENQWDYIGSSGSNQYINGSMTISQAGYVDLFCWVGASASYDNYGIMYDNDGGVWGHEATNFGNSTNDALKHDWGHNPITNGGNVADMWRTPTNDEWVYLINSRTTAAGTAPTINGTADARYAKAKLFGTNRGLIIFPDTYVHPDGVAYPTGINAAGNTSWNGNQYSDADWAKMEAAGCVFLPCTGIRVYYTQINDKETRGFYASSTPRPDSWQHAKVMQFLDNSCTPNANRYRRDAGPVRLVQDKN